jgi:hypothetical protein
MEHVGKESFVSEGALNLNVKTNEFLMSTNVPVNIVE